MRNRIAHGYAWINIETVKATVEEDLPAVETAVRALFGEARRAVPPGGESVMIPAKKSGPSRTRLLPKHELRTADSVDELLDEM